MDLWIRSQDRERLIKPIDFYIEANINFHTAEPIDFDIYALNFANSDIKIGRYKSKERALEVLDEIQNILQPKISVKPTIEEDMNPEYIHKHFVSNGKEVNVVELNTYVYEMPIE